MSQESLTFPHKLDRIRDAVLAQGETLGAVAEAYADAITAGGVVHVYANGHSRVAVEELCVRMGALTGFHPILAVSLASFTDVVGASGLRVGQTVEKVEGLGAKLLDEVDVAPGEPLVVISATGQTQAAVDIALEFTRRYPENPLIAIASEQQAREGAPKHSSGKTLYHAIREAKRGFFLDNGMPMGDVSTTVIGQTGTYNVCPLSSIGALTIVQSLNELTIRALDRRGVRHHVLANMHLGQTQDNYDAWLGDQRRRYAGTLYNFRLRESRS
jgi:uncharacterized phosphosugar-binding protein